MDSLTLKLKDPFGKVEKDKFSSEDFKQSIKKISSKLLKDRFQYQAVIMAAGRGSRMKIKYPKALYEFNYPNERKSILSNTISLINQLDRKVTEIFVVIREDDLHFFKELSLAKKVKLITLPSEEIRGTAVCLDKISPLLKRDTHLLLFWGDLVLLPKSDILLSIKVHEILENSLTFPTRYKINPYVAFIRNREGLFSSVVHSNEKGVYSDWAEQDCSFFILNFTIISQVKEFIKLFSSKNFSSKEGEIDFIHFITYLSNLEEEVCGLPIVNDNYVYDVNTPASATEIQNNLNKLDEHTYKKVFLSNS